MKRLSAGEISSIVRLYASGENCAQLASDFACGLSTIYWVLNHHGSGVKDTARTLSDKIPDLVAMRKSEMTYKDIAKALGVSPYTVQRELSRLGMEYSEPEKQALQIARNRVYAHSEADVTAIIRMRCQTIEYVSGYVRNTDKFTVRCTVCGREWKTSLHTLIHGSGCCPLCRLDQKEREREQKATEISAKKALVAELRKRDKESRIEMQRIAERQTTRTCPVCGAKVTNKVYCGPTCRNRAKNSRKEIARRSRLKDACVDRDITLEALFKRDAGVCHICGERCNFEDYTVLDDTFIAGNFYPSIDHVVPLAKGGHHSWDNVKLAHRVCNSRKGTLSHPPGVPHGGVSGE